MYSFRDNHSSVSFFSLFFVLLLHPFYHHRTSFSSLIYNCRFEFMKTEDAQDSRLSRMCNNYPPSSQRPLPAPSPLRTGHATFIASDSTSIEPHIPQAPAVPPPDFKSETSPTLHWMSIFAILRSYYTPDLSPRPVYNTLHHDFLSCPAI